MRVAREIWGVALVAGFVYLVLQAHTSSAVAQNAVLLSPGDDIQRAIDSNPPGASFLFNPGTYRITRGLIPKSGNTFKSKTPRGAVISGARILTGWVVDGADYRVVGQSQENPSRTGDCIDGRQDCRFADWVYWNNAPMIRVLKMVDLVPGAFFFDYEKDTIYVRDNPAGQIVEAAVATRGFDGHKIEAEDVTIEDLVIEKFANEWGSCALQGRLSWTIKGNEVRLNHGIGIGDGKVVSGNYSHHNGQEGLGGGWLSDGMLVENNEVAFNNSPAFAGFDYEHSGGAKFVTTRHLILRRNYAHDNGGPGLWLDGDNVDAVIEGNYTKSSKVAGILVEIGSDTLIKNNVSENDGENPVSSSKSESLLYGKCGICVSSAMNVEVVGNTVRNAINGIGAPSMERGASKRYPLPWRVQNLYVHDNIIINPKNIAAGIEAYASHAAAFSGWNNRFEGNVYFLSDLTRKWFQWNNEGQTAAWWLANIDKKGAVYKH